MSYLAGVLCALPVYHPAREAGNLALSGYQNKPTPRLLPCAASTSDGFLEDLLSLSHLTSPGFLGWVMALDEGLLLRLAFPCFALCSWKMQNAPANGEPGRSPCSLRASWIKQSVVHFSIFLLVLPLLLNVLSHVPGCHSVCFCLVTLGLMKIIIIFSSSTFFTDPHKPGMIFGVGVFPDSPSCSLVSWRADSQYCPFLHHGPLSRMMAREPCVPAFPLTLLPCHRRRPTPSYE